MTHDYLNNSYIKFFKDKVLENYFLRPTQWRLKFLLKTGTSLKFSQYEISYLKSYLQLINVWFFHTYDIQLLQNIHKCACRITSGKIEAYR